MSVHRNQLVASANPPNPRRNQAKRGTQHASRTADGVRVVTELTRRKQANIEKMVTAETHRVTAAHRNCANKTDVVQSTRFVIADIATGDMTVVIALPPPSHAPRKFSLIALFLRSRSLKFSCQARTRRCNSGVSMLSDAARQVIADAMKQGEENHPGVARDLISIIKTE